MLCSVHRCLLCGHTAIDGKTDGRLITTSCHACLAVLTIEFDPPDQPELHARIERLDDADDGGTPLPRAIAIDERPTRPTREIIPSLDRLDAADDRLPIYEWTRDRRHDAAREAQ